MGRGHSWCRNFVYSNFSGLGKGKEGEGVEPLFSWKKKKMFMLNFESLKHFIGHGLHVKGRTHIGGIGIGRKPKT
jgi:hypothetical protein